jgi:2-keto-3-deoxy-L-fuconate dehydrogenase
MDRLKGKVAIVTGAASGIGRASAALFAAEGACVMIGDLDDAGGRETVRQIEAQGGQAAFLRTDVARAESAEALVRGAVECWGALHVLHNNAYWAPTGRNVLNTSEDEWDRTQAVTLKSMYLMSRAAIPEMLKGGGGSIVNMASVAGSITGVPNRFAYGASKAAVIGLTKSVAADFVAHGIRCNAICPGTVDTPSLQGRLRATGDYEKARRDFEARQPMGRLGSADEIAALALYLASDESGFTTGQIHVIDGGWTT